MKKKNMRIKAPSLMLHLAVMLFGFSGVISRAVQASSVMIAGGRVVCSSLILFTLLKAGRVELRAKERTHTYLTILGGILLAAHWTTFFQSVRTASVAIGTITFSTFPLFLLFLEPLLFREKISVKNCLLAAGLLVGVLITVPEFSMENGTTMGIVWGMICSLTYALLTLCNRKLAVTYSGMWVSFREQSVAAVLLAPLMLLSGEKLTAGDCLGIGAIGVICTACAFSLFVTAQKYVSAQTAGIVAGMETVYGIIFAMIFLGEFPGAREIAGGIVIMICAGYSSLLS